MRSVSNLSPPLIQRKEVEYGKRPVETLFVIQNDCVVAEYYAGKHSIEGSARQTAADSQFKVASVRKSYIGFAAAWALNSGAVRSFDDPVLRYVSVGREESEFLKGVTIGNLLTHTHGLLFLFKLPVNFQSLFLGMDAYG